MQSAPQLMPAGVLVTVPLPVPVLVTVSLYVPIGFKVKLAVTDFAALMFTQQLVPVPPHAPLHPLKEESAAGVAVSLTTVPDG